MILLLGGTSESAPLATALAQAGYQVLVSTATDIALDVGSHPNIHRRAGKLDRTAMIELLQRQNILAILDATHPYAAHVQATAQNVADNISVPYFRWLRPATAFDGQDVLQAVDHDHAARLACAFGRPVLLTTGSRNLKPYVLEASRGEVSLIVRVLDHPQSVEACRAAGIDDSFIVCGRGPFSKEENLALIRKFDIGVLVTKDGGDSGGIKAKLEAAESEGCRVVIVQRPRQTAYRSFSTVRELVDALSRTLGLGTLCPESDALAAL